MNTVLDYGHGGIKNGVYTTAPRKMFNFGDVVAYEGVLNREIGQFLHDHLEQQHKVFLTAPGPEDISLQQRVKISNSIENSIFISIHCNASPKHNASGFELFTTVGETQSDALAFEINKSVDPCLKTFDHKNRGIKESNFYVLRNTKSPAVLIECGFFDYGKDFELLSNYYFQEQITLHIAKGINNYVSKFSR